MHARMHTHIHVHVYRQCIINSPSDYSYMCAYLQWRSIWGLTLLIHRMFTAIIRLDY